MSGNGEEKHHRIRIERGSAATSALVWVLSGATFFIFVQAYMVAPLISRLAGALGTFAQTIGLIVPAYMIPYGVSTLFYGLLSDRSMAYTPSRNHRGSNEPAHIQQQQLKEAVAKAGFIEVET